MEGCIRQRVYCNIWLSHSCLAEPTVSMMVSAYNGRLFGHNPYDLPRNSHVLAHYDLLPGRLPGSLQMPAMDRKGGMDGATDRV